MAGARTEEIAAAAHANKAMLYYYFGNKRRLHRAVLENLFRQLHGRSVYAPPRRGQSPHERLSAFVSGYFDFLATHPNYPRLVQREAMESKRNFGMDRSPATCGLFTSNWCALSKKVSPRANSGRVDPDHTAFSILGMTTSYFAAAPILSEIVGRNLLAPQAVAGRKAGAVGFSGSRSESTCKRSRPSHDRPANSLCVLSILFADRLARLSR